MDTIKPRRIKDGSTTEVPGGASGASDQVDIGSAQGLRQSSERARADREQLGINAETLRGWVTQAEVDAGARPGASTSEAEKIAQLERDNRELRRANADPAVGVGLLRGGARPPLTLIRTFAGWVYASFVLDVFSRRVVGWQLSTSLRTKLALDALNMRLWTRRHDGHDTSDLIHHSDRLNQVSASPSATPNASPRPAPSPRSEARATATTASIYLSLPRRSDPCYDRPCGCLRVDVSTAAAAMLRPLVGRAVT